MFKTIKERRKRKKANLENEKVLAHILMKICLSEVKKHIELEKDSETDEEKEYNSLLKSSFIALAIIINSYAEDLMVDGNKANKMFHLKCFDSHFTEGVEDLCK